MKSVTLNINNNVVVLTSDENGMFSLNQLHKASGTTATKRPGNWIANRQTIDFLNTYSSAGILAVETVNGGTRRGTWGLEQVIFAYAEWISPEFHRAVIEAFRHAVRGEGEAAVNVAQSVARTDGIIQRKQFASALGKHGAQQGDYRNLSDVINIAVLGSASSTLKEAKGLKKSARLRNHLTEQELTELNAAEAIATLILSRNKTKTHGSMREAVYKAVDTYKAI